MSKAEILHELYHQCSGINFSDSHEILSSAESEEEANLYVRKRYPMCWKIRL